MDHYSARQILEYVLEAHAGHLYGEKGPFLKECDCPEWAARALLGGRWPTRGFTAQLREAAANVYRGLVRRARLVDGTSKLGLTGDLWVEAIFRARRDWLERQTSKAEIHTRKLKEELWVEDAK
jgi:hypothetical protein